MDPEENVSEGSPRYIDETIEANENLRPDLEETKERGTDQEPDVK